MKNLVEKEKENKLEAKKTVQLVRVLYPHLERVPDIEIQKAIAVCKHLGLDPIKREVHFVPFGRTVQLVVSYTEYIKRAERSGKLNGWSIKFEGKTLQELKAVVTIYRKDWQYPFEWVVYYKEVARKTPTWEQMPLFMLRKVAISQAFRLAFPEEVAHLPYEEAEVIEELHNYNEKEDIPLETTQIEEQPEEKIDPKTGEIIQEERAEEEATNKATEQQLKAIFAIMNKLGIAQDRDERLAYASFVLGKDVKSFTELSKEEASKLIQEMQIQLNVFQK